MVFRKGGGTLQRNLKFEYKGENIEIVKKFTYSGVVFTTGGSFMETHETLSSQALKAIFKLSYVNKFTDFSVSHMLGLFDKLILPILTYGIVVSGVKIQTQNNFVYRELGRVPLRNHRLVSVIRYWFKVIQCDDAKYTKLTYNMMLNDLQRFPTKSSWAKSVKSLLDNMGFGHVWIEQGVGNILLCFYVSSKKD